MRVFRLTNNIDRDNKNKEYNLIEVFMESDKSDVSNLSDLEKLSDYLNFTHTVITLVCQTKIEDMLHKLYKSYIRSKST